VEPTRWRRTGWSYAAVAIVLVSACTPNDTGISTQVPDQRNTSLPELIEPATTAPGSTATSENATADPASCPPREALDIPGDLQSVPVEDVGTVDGAAVAAAIYPLADTEGNPWSQWGQGVVISDGRFVSAVGDHLGRNGTSWFYEFDPATDLLTRTVEVSDALGHQADDWGYGKIHAPMGMSECGDVLAATYWGTRRDLELGDSYRGDQLIRYDPWARDIQPLGVPIDGFGIPSIAVTPDHQWIIGEAVDPESDPDAGDLFVARVDDGEVVHVVEDGNHVGFRNVMIDSRGHALYSVGDRSLVGIDPVSGMTTTLLDVLPGEWLRASTAPGPDGAVYGVTREPDILFRLDAAGTFTTLGPVEDYVASLALSPDGRTVYYVPGAHGNGWTEGTPLIAVDIGSGEHTEIVRLNDLIEPALGVRVGGSYNVVADPSGDVIYIGLNAGELDDDAPFGSVVLAVVELP
jgi:hypothetical protein